MRKGDFQSILPYQQFKSYKQAYNIIIDRKAYEWEVIEISTDTPVQPGSWK